MSFLSDGLTGLTHATPLFLVAAALTLIFRATRLLDLGQPALAALAAALAIRLPLDPALALLAIPAGLAVFGAALELTLWRHLYRAPLLSQLLVALGLFLLFRDAAQLLWTNHAAIRPAWSQASVPLGALSVPISALAIILIGPLVFGLLLLLPRTVSHSRRPLIVALATALSGLAGTLSLLTPPAASTGVDLTLLADALLVLLLGGLGSLPGAFLATLAIALIEAFSADLFPQAAQVLPLAITAIVLLVRPTGLLGHALPLPIPPQALLIRPAPLSAKLLFAAAVLLALVAPVLAAPATLPLLTAAAITILFAASLHFLIGPGGIPSLGHAAFFGIGAYAAALFARSAQATPNVSLLAAALAIGTLAAGLAAFLVGTVLARLSAVAIAMLTVAVARMAGDAAARLGPIAPLNWPTPTPQLPAALGFWLILLLCLGLALLLRRLLYAPFGYALRAARDNPVRAAAIGLPIPLLRLAAVTVAGTIAGLAGALAAVATSVATPILDRSAEALLMLALGGLQAIASPLVGAFTYTAVVDALPASPLWPLLLGPALIAATLLLPNGIAGSSISVWRRAP